MKIQYGGINCTLAMHDIAHRKLTMKYDQLIVGAASAMSDGEISVAEVGGTSLPPMDDQTAEMVKVESEPAVLSPSMPDNLLTNLVMSDPEGSGKVLANEIQSTSSVLFGDLTQSQSMEKSLGIYQNLTSGNQTFTCTLTSGGANGFSITAGGGTRTLSSLQTVEIRAIMSGAGQARGSKTGAVTITATPNGSTPYSHTFSLTSNVREDPKLGFRYFVSSVYMNGAVSGICSITNNGSQSLTIQSISLVNNQNAQFQIISGNGSGSIAAGQSRDIAIQYLATAHGASGSNSRILRVEKGG